MPRADHTLTHAAPALPRAGSCLEEGSQLGSTTPAMPHARPPRQVSELCTFRSTPTHKLEFARAAAAICGSTSRCRAASQPADPQTRAVRAHAASPLSGLAQHIPGSPHHPEAGPTPMLHSTRHQGAVAGDDCSRSRLGRLLSFPTLRTRAAGHHPPRPTHRSESPRAGSGRVVPSRPTCKRVPPTRCAPQRAAHSPTVFTRPTSR